MSIIRVEHNKGYTVMSNEHLRDMALSLRARGLMSLMLSDIDEHRYSVRMLEDRCKEGRDAITTALRELEAAGYLVRSQSRKSGSFAGVDYILYEHKQSPFTKNPSTVEPFTDFPETGKPITENPSTVEPFTDFPETGKPITENPSAEEIPRESNTSIPPIAPQGGKREPKKPWKPERFEALWYFYPRGEAKAKAKAAWEKAHLTDEEIDQMGRMLRKQLRTEEWQRGIGIPYLATYINQRRWEDEKLAPTANREEAPAAWN